MIADPLTGFWIKSHTDILDNVDIATLPDNLWRRFHEIKLILGHGHPSGNLPEIREIAFRTRKDEKVIADELKELANRGLIVAAGETYSLPHFCEEQGPDSDAERKSRQRQRERNPSLSHEPVTNRDTERVEEIRIEKTDRAEVDAPLAFSATASSVDDGESDEEFWQRMASLRPDLDVKEQRGKMEVHLRKNGKGKLTRKFAESWMIRESVPLKSSSLPSKASKTMQKVDEVHAAAWLAENYDGGDTTMTFHQWPPFAQQDYIKSQKVDEAA